MTILLLFNQGKKILHIVIFTGGDFTSPEDSVSYFKNFPIVDYVIAADSGADTLEKYQEFYKGQIDFSPDFILGDMDSISKYGLKKYQNRIQLYPTDKDYTDTELALEKAHEILKKNSLNSIITLLGGAGGFSDHFLGILDTFSSANHADFWLCGNQIFCLLTKNNMLSISNLKLNDRISIARTTDYYKGGFIHSDGLEWESNLFRKTGMPSISNRISKEYLEEKKPVKISVTEGKYLVIVPVSVSLKKEKLCFEE